MQAGFYIEGAGFRQWSYAQAFAKDRAQRTQSCILILDAKGNVLAKECPRPKLESGVQS